MKQERQKCPQMLANASGKTDKHKHYLSVLQFYVSSLVVTETVLDSFQICTVWCSKLFMCGNGPLHSSFECGLGSAEVTTHGSALTLHQLVIELLLHAHKGFKNHSACRFYYACMRVVFSYLFFVCFVLVKWFWHPSSNLITHL